MPGRVLIVDDDLATCELLSTRLARRGYETSFSTSAADALEKIRSGELEVIVVDHNMPTTSGIELCREVAANRPDLPVIVITAFGSLETAIAAIRAGAYDFITKPFEIEELALAVERAIQHRAMREEVKRLRRVLAEAQQFEEIIGTSAPIKKVFALIEQVAPANPTVLLTGESGTGKELVAQAFHRRGPNAAGPFVAINCGAMTESLLESELFGIQERPGALKQADGGTLFLDEIGDMPIGMQVKLLRALETKRIRTVGVEQEVELRARIIASTNKDLEAEIEEGRFRQDLYYRINVLYVGLPPLRVRGGDVLLLSQHFVERCAARFGKPEVVGISPQAAERLVAYPWPGNVRELQNCIERATMLTSYERIAVEDLPDRVQHHLHAETRASAEDSIELLPLAEVERRHVFRVLEATHGNKTLAAELLGLDRRTLYRKLERWGHEGEDAG